MSQATAPGRLRSPRVPAWCYSAAAVVMAAGVLAAAAYCLPTIHSLIASGKLPSRPASPAMAGNESTEMHDHDHAGHDHKHSGHDHAGHDEHAGHNEANSIELSEQAKKNIGLQVGKVELKPFTKTLSVPGMIVERPGRSLIEVTAPMTGVITRIYLVEGEAVEPGQKLFELRLTHEELVQSQANLLRTAEELDVIGREIERIEKLTMEGGIAAKTLLERKYEQQKQQAALRAQRQALLLHGLSPAQVDVILHERKLLQSLTVAAPTMTDGGPSAAGTLYQVQSLRVTAGQHVEAGHPLAILADHAELFIQGEAFERDVPIVSRIAERGLPVTATLETEGSQPESIRELRVLYLAALVNPATRTLDFYVTLPNEKQRDAKLDDGHRFIAWRFRPGQRVQLQIPALTLPDRIVLPAEAIAQDGAETYVFTPNGDHFDRRSVHVEHRDPGWVVIANDGSLFPGDMVALCGAPQLQMAIKNKAGGGIDPHAGHNH